MRRQPVGRRFLLPIHDKRIMEGKNKLIITLLVLTLIVGVIAAYFFIFNKSDSNSKSDNRISNTNLPTYTPSPTSTKIYSKQEVSDVEALLSKPVSEMPELTSDFPCDQIRDSFLRDVCHYRIRLSFDDSVMDRCAGTFSDCKNRVEKSLQDDIKNKGINSGYVDEFLPIINCSSFPTSYQEICRYKKQKSKECENYTSGSKEANILKDVCEIAKAK